MTQLFKTQIPSEILFKLFTNLSVKQSNYFIFDLNQSYVCFNPSRNSILGFHPISKILVESKKMTVNSAPLVSELKTFVAHGTSYAAKPGETDDLVMSTLLVVRMLLLLQTYHAELDTHLRDHGDNLIEPMPFISLMR